MTEKEEMEKEADIRDRLLKGSVAASRRLAHSSPSVRVSPNIFYHLRIDDDPLEEELPVNNDAWIVGTGFILGLGIAWRALTSIWRR